MILKSLNCKLDPILFLDRILLRFRTSKHGEWLKLWAIHRDAKIEWVGEKTGKYVETHLSVYVNLRPLAKSP